MNSLSANKKILITIGSFALIVVFLAVGLKLAGSKNSSEEPVETTTAFIGYVEEIDTVEETSAEPVSATIPDLTADISEKIAASIIAYMSGQYYIDGYMTAGDGTVTDINIAISGKDFYTTTEMEGMSVSILYKSGKIYFINNEQKKYLEFSDLMLDNYDVDFSELEEIADYLNLTQYNFTGFERYADTENYEYADCFKYYNDDMTVIFYFVNEELKQVDMGNGDGVINSSTHINEFSPEVPADTMSLAGLSRSSLLGFFGTSLVQ